MSKSKITNYEKLDMQHMLIERFKQIYIETHGNVPSVKDACEWYTEIILSLTNSQLQDDYENLILYPITLV